MAISASVSIGSLAKRAGVSVETIRYYERAGLLPAPPRSGGGFRRYSPAHAERLWFIRRARGLALSLEEIRELLALAEQRTSACKNARAIAARHLAVIRTRIDDLQRIELAMHELVHACADGASPSCPLLETLTGSNRK